MRINLVGEGTFQIDENGQVTLLPGASPELASVRDLASEAAVGPPLWAGPLEFIRQWSSDQGHTLEEFDVPELLSVEDRVY